MLLFGRDDVTQHWLKHESKAGPTRTGSFSLLMVGEFGNSVLFDLPALEVSCDVHKVDQNCSNFTMK